MLTLALVALAALLPLLASGPSCGHDFLFHLQNWIETASQWRHGILRPVWAFHAAWNAGEPRLLFYPPLSWCIGGLLTIVLPWPAVPFAFTFLCLFLSGLTMRRLLLRWTQPPLALLGASIYCLTPYMLFVAYTRTAYAELLAAAWMPLLLASVLRKHVRALPVAGAVALLWITNAPAAVMGCYALLVLGCVRAVWIARQSGWRRALDFAGTVASGTVLGLLLDAWYIVPVLHERPLVQMTMALTPDMNPLGNFLFRYGSDPYRNGVIHRASWIAVVTIAVALLAGAFVLLSNLKPRESSEAQRPAALANRQRIAVALLCLTVVIAFLQTPASALLWQRTPEMMFLQFPWRWIAVASAIAVVLCALAAQPFFRRTQPRLAPFAIAGIVLALAVGIAAGLHYREACDDDFTLAQFRDSILNGQGTEPTDEYTPADADNEALHSGLPEAWYADEVDAAPAFRGGEVGPITVSDGNPGHLSFFVPASNTAGYLIVRVRAYPAWTITTDGMPLDQNASLQKRNDGLLCIPVAPGREHEVDVRLAATPDRWTGAALTLVAVLLVPFVDSRRRQTVTGQVPQ